VRALGGVLVDEGEPCELLFDTAGRVGGEAERVVTISDELPGATYFVVEPDGAQLASLPELRSEVDSVFPFEEFQAAFDRSAARGKRGKVVLDVAGT
ncbi:MAG: zinc-binding dehydrogenase, partial [Actinobacteria bacterium]|nr:zinc-binding dehydrogenase [Actinomycetota bacterium]